MTAGKVAKNLQRFREAVAIHEGKHGCTAWGVGLAHFDMARLGFEENEELWPGVVVKGLDGEQAGMFRVLCDQLPEEPAGVVEAIGATGGVI